MNKMTRSRSDLELDLLIQLIKNSETMNFTLCNSLGRIDHTIHIQGAIIKSRCNIKTNCAIQNMHSTTLSE